VDIEAAEEEAAGDGDAGAEQAGRGEARGVGEQRLAQREGDVYEPEEGAVRVREPPQEPPRL